jgi:TPP-dependent pyruvate/acetoin dehydrogenase alpha subunit
MKIDQQTQLNLFYQMLRIRMVEEAIADAYPEQKMRTPVHLSIGQEAAAVASGLALEKTDYAMSTHRGHAHYLAKGGDLKAMIAEIYGKVTGCCRGRGGSMHLIDESVGFMGTTAIVGNTIPVGVGLGLSIQLDSSDRISCIYVGDAATEEGVFYEALNFAAVKKLPVLFVCENNLYSVYSPLSKRQPKGRKIHELAKAIGAHVMTADGYNMLESYETMCKAVDKVRAGVGPCFVELSTYRWREHCGPAFDNDIGYRSVEEYEAWASKDPVAQFKKDLQKTFSLKEEVFADMQNKIQVEIKKAFAFAEASDFPDAIEATTGEYVSSPVKESVQCES